MNVYSIRPGDTLTSIAQRVGSTVEQLARTNNIANVDHIQAGAQLQIPGSRDEFQAQQPQNGMPNLNPTNPTTNGADESATDAIAVGRSLIGRAYGDPAGASAAPVGRDSPFMHCAQFVNAVYPDLPASAPQLHASAQQGVEPKPGDVVTSSQPAPWGHVGIMTEQGTILHSIPGRGVHESSRADFEMYSPITGVVPR